VSLPIGGVAVQSVGPEVVVRLEYGLFDAEGELVEAPGPDETIEFIFGVGQAPAVFERAVDGLALGDSRRVELAPHEAFGPRDEEDMVVVERGELPPEVVLGDELEAENEDGELIFLRVVELQDDLARLDANHPLAGQRISLELRVVGMRAATSQELAAANAALDEQTEQAPDVLVSRLLLRNRYCPPESK
jgi:FKBP-type peptidyl-prolyl cis-trans isomerase 2